MKSHAIEQALRTDNSARAAATARLHRRLRAVILLSGTLRVTPFGQAVARSHLDLPLDADQSILAGWRTAAHNLAERCGLNAIALRVLLNQRAARPVSATATSQVRLTLEEDQRPLRGTAGVLRDAIEDYDDNDLLLVANGAQAMLRPLDELVTAMTQRGGDVCLAANDDGTPCGFMLIRCAALRGVAQRGFVDMKEQALPAIARRHAVRVLPCDPPAGMPVRTLPDYIRALRWRHHGGGAGAFAETWQCSFSIAEPTANVHPTARIHDSVVLGGTSVGAHAVIVQSVIGPGATIDAKQTVVDRVVGADTGGRK